MSRHVALATVGTVDVDGNILMDGDYIHVADDLVMVDALVHPGTIPVRVRWGDRVLLPLTGGQQVVCLFPDERTFEGGVACMAPNNERNTPPKMLSGSAWDKKKTLVDLSGFDVEVNAKSATCKGPIHAQTSVAVGPAPTMPVATHQGLCDAFMWIMEMANTVNVALATLMGAPDPNLSAIILKASVAQENPLYKFPTLTGTPGVPLTTEEIAEIEQRSSGEGESTP